MKWLARLFESDSPAENSEQNDHDLHRAAAALLMEVARTDGEVDHREQRLLIKAVRERWHL